MKKLVCISFLFLFVFSFVNAQRQDQKKLTIDWIISNEMDDIEQLPYSKWLADNTLLLYDSRLPEAERTFELIDPSKNSREKYFDKSAFYNTLKSKYSLAEKDFPIDSPDDVSSNCNDILYIVEGDIFIVDLKSGDVNKITNTSSTEKNARFSPDGLKIAFVRDNNLFVYSIINKEEKQLTFDGSETLLNGTVSWVYWEEVFDRNDFGFYWSDDSRKLAYYQTDESEVSIVHFMDYKPWVPDVITQRYPKTGEPNPKVRIGIVDIDKATTDWLPIDDNKYEYIVRVNWLPDNNTVAIQTLNRMQDKLELYFASTTSKTVQLILTETEDSWINTHDDLTFLKNSNQFIWLSERSGYAHLYLYNLDGTLVNQITKGEWQVNGDRSDSKSIRFVDEEKKKLYFIGKEKSFIERHLYQVNLDGTELRRIYQEDGSHSICFSNSGKYYTDGFSNFTTMPSLSLHEVNGNKLQLISEGPIELFAECNLQFPEYFEIPAYDGFQLPAYIFKPKDFDSNKKYPLIIFVYGGPSAQTVVNQWQRYTLYFNLLVRNGYLVAGIDNRSATGISKAMEASVNRRIASSNELKDLVSAAKWLKQQSYIDSNRLGVWGWSGGGTFTLNALTNSQEFKAGIAVAGVTDWHFYDTKFGERGMKTPEANPDGYEETSLLKTAKNLHGDLLIVHGTYDDNVHIQNAYWFMEELFKAGKDFDMLIYPMRKHGISDKPARRHLFKKMVQYWKLHL